MGEQEARRSFIRRRGFTPLLLLAKEGYMAQITINGQKYQLLFNGAAMFAVHDIFG